jgi:hypothetical protein
VGSKPTHAMGMNEKRKITAEFAERRGKIE